MGTYYVASLNGSGWFSNTSQFKSQISEAKEMSYDEAIKKCRMFKSNNYVCVPVRKEDMERI